MFAMGFAIFIAVLLLMVKMPHRLLLRMLNHDLLIDFTVSALVLMIHFGSFEGVMSATIAGLLTSLATTGAKRLFGFIRSGIYYPGYMRLSLGPDT